MKRPAVILVAVAVTIAFTAVVAAAPGNSDGKGESGGKPVSIPDDARKVAPGVYYLGEAKHNGQRAEGYMYVRYKKGHHHRDGHGGGPPGGGGDDDSRCFSFIFDRHTEWQTVEPWVVNPANGEDLSDSFVLDNLAKSMEKWEAVDAASTDIFGSGSLTDDPLTVDTDSPDDKNEVYFGSIESEGAIAVTVVWAFAGGSPNQRRIIEWDQVYDQVDFDWSSSGESDKMDFENINSHELGHSIGMDHTECSEQTMFGTASDGETKKRTLENGDKSGASELYS